MRLELQSNPVLHFLRDLAGAFGRDSVDDLLEPPLLVAEDEPFRTLEIFALPNRCILTKKRDSDIGIVALPNH